MTPPLFLRDPSDGSRQIIEVDDSVTTSGLQHSGRTLAFLTLAPGLTVRVRSKCINKRRITWLLVTPALGDPDVP